MCDCSCLGLCIGEYFLAELIESQDTHHKTFVAEVNTHTPLGNVSCSPQVGGHGVGFISVTSEVDLSLLDQCFQLECYHHLRHPAPPTLGNTTSCCNMYRVIQCAHRVRSEVTVSSEYRKQRSATHLLYCQVCVCVCVSHNSLSLCSLVEEKEAAEGQQDKQGKLTSQSLLTILYLCSISQ